ncbi:MAG: hypothetical protein ABI162_11370 [Luteolibacter sp.]
MKIFVSIGLAMLFAFSSVFGQNSAEIEVKRFSESLIKRFESLPDKEAFDLWLESRDPIIAGLGMMTSAVENERVDFLKRVFGSRGDFLYLIASVKEMPESAKRDKMVIMMLRSDSPFWHSEEVEVYQDGSRGTELDNAIEPFVSSIKKHFPAKAVNEELFSTKAKRLKLADDLEAAMQKGAATPQTERPKKRMEPREVPQVSTSNSPENFGSIPSTEDSAPPESKPTWFEQLKWASVFAVLTGMFWMLFKKRKNS